jgi:hypothetical protein
VALAIAPGDGDPRALDVWRTIGSIVWAVFSAYGIAHRIADPEAPGSRRFRERYSEQLLETFQRARVENAVRWVDAVTGATVEDIERFNHETQMAALALRSLVECLDAILEAALNE